MTEGQLLSGKPSAETRPAKRVRNEEVVADVPSLQQDTDFWFSDGSLILISAEGTGFCVHQSVLARTCKFFSDLEKPASDDVQKLRLTNSTYDIKCFMHYLYDAGYFYTGKRTTYLCLAALLRMATKYVCHVLRSTILLQIARMYPFEYDVIPVMDFYILEGDASNHAQLTINMLRENNVPSLLPAVFHYACCVAPPNHASFFTSRLSAEDEHRLNIGRSEVTRAMVDVAWKHMQSDKFSDACKFDICLATRRTIFRKHSKVALQAHRSLKHAMPHTLYKVPQNEADLKEGEVCSACWQDWSKDEGPAFKLVWRSLHIFFGLAVPMHGVVAPPPAAQN